MSAIQPYYKKSLALVIGINSYADPRFVPLGEAEDDARNVAKVLRTAPYDFEVGLLLGPQATRQRILDAIYALRKAEPEDRVLVYFAGHGYTETDKFGEKTGYLAAVDTRYNRNSSALKLTDLTDLRRYSDAMHIGFIFDACFSGQALGITRGTSEVLADRRRAFQVISAGAGDQTVSDYNSMTDAMIEALQGETPDQGDMLTFNSLGLYLQQTISARSGRMQIPQFGSLTGHQGDDLVLYYDTSPHLPRELEQALDSSSANVRWGAVADLTAIAQGDDEELAALADDRLTQLLDDPDERVRNAAQRYINPAITQQSVTLGQRPSPVTPEARGTAPPWMQNRLLWIAGGIGALIIGVLVVIGLLSLVNPDQGGTTGEPTVEGTPLTREDLDPTQIALIDNTSGTQQDDVLPEDLVLLEVPFYSQHGDTAAYSLNDAGPACLAMVIYAQSGETITVDDVYTRSGSTNRGILSYDDLTTMAAAFDIGLQTETETTLDDIRGWIDGGTPVIVLVDYGPFLEASNVSAGETLYQWVLIVGYDDEHVYVHDPYYQPESNTEGSAEDSPVEVDPGESGRNRPWPLALFAAVWQQTVLIPGELVVEQVEFVAPTDTESTITGFDPPVGTDEERRGDQVWPGEWFDATGYGTFTSAVGGSYHTGVDLNLNSPEYDSDRNAPVYAAGSGVVIFADPLSGTWGNVVIIRHDALENGEVYWSRYSALGEIMVEKGAQVERGQQIGTIGNANGQLAYFLHFDIAKTNILERSPGHWPGTNLESVLENYVDPKAFIEEHRPTVAASGSTCPDYSPPASRTVSGKGMFIWKLHLAENGDPQAMAQRAREAGLSYVVIKVADGSRAYNADLSPEVVEALREANIQVWGWQFIYGDSPFAEADAAIAQICSLNLDGLVIDAETAYENRSSEATTYVSVLSDAVPDVPLALTSFGQPEFYPEFPWTEFLSSVDFAMPQVYWVDGDPFTILVDSYQAYTDLGVEDIIPVGAAYEGFDWRPTVDEINVFFATADELSLPGVSFWSWDYAGSEEGVDLWEAIANNNTFD